LGGIVNRENIIAIYIVVVPTLIAVVGNLVVHYFERREV
jgi:hypothetical protein